MRFLAAPATAIGLFSDRDMIVRHLMQVHHYNPAYDLQLLRMFDDGIDDGIDELERLRSRSPGPRHITTATT